VFPNADSSLEAIPAPTNAAETFSNYVCPVAVYAVLTLGCRAKIDPPVVSTILIDVIDLVGWLTAGHVHESKSMRGVGHPVDLDKAIPIGVD